jgi:hypothetical protein
MVDKTGEVIFRRVPKFGFWIGVMFAIGLVGVLLLGLGQMGIIMAELGWFFGIIGIVWLCVGAFVLLVIRAAGRGMVTEMRRVAETLRVRTAATFGQSAEQIVPLSTLSDWRWQTQGVGGTARPIRYRQVMLVFNQGKRVLRVPLTGASVVNLTSLRDLAPSVVDDMVAHNADIVRDRSMTTSPVS